MAAPGTFRTVLQTVSVRQLFSLPCPRGHPFTLPREKAAQPGRGCVLFAKSAQRKRKTCRHSGWAKRMWIATATLNLKLWL